MVTRNTRPTVHDIRALKARGHKLTMLYVTTLDEAAAANAAGIEMLSIESRFFSPEMREAAGRCFVQVGLPFGPYGTLATAEWAAFVAAVTTGSALPVTLADGVAALAMAEAATLSAKTGAPVKLSTVLGAAK